MRYRGLCNPQMSRGGLPLYGASAERILTPLPRKILSKITYTRRSSQGHIYVFTKERAPPVVKPHRSQTPVESCRVTIPSRYDLPSFLRFNARISTRGVGVSVKHPDGVRPGVKNGCAVGYRA